MYYKMPINPILLKNELYKWIRKIGWLDKNTEFNTKSEYVKYKGNWYESLDGQDHFKTLYDIYWQFSNNYINIDRFEGPQYERQINGHILYRLREVKDKFKDNNFNKEINELIAELDKLNPEAKDPQILANGLQPRKKSSDQLKKDKDEDFELSLENIYAEQIKKGKAAARARMPKKLAEKRRRRSLINRQLIEKAAEAAAKAKEKISKNGYQLKF